MPSMPAPQTGYRYPAAARYARGRRISQYTAAGEYPSAADRRSDDSSTELARVSRVMPQTTSP